MNKETRNTKQAIWVLWIIMGLNFGVAIFKIAIGTIANSGSIIADGYHSLSDGSGNIVGIVGLSIAGRPIDNNHPYGHKKFETISSMIIGMLLFVVGSKVAFNSITNIIHPKTPEISMISFVVMISTLIVNIFVVIYERSQGIKLSSDVLVSDSEHTKSDVLITCGVIVTMILLQMGVPPIIDGCVSLLISLFIFKASFEIFMEATKTLTDSAVLNSEEIYEVTMSCEEVKECHKIRSRGRKDEVFIDLHVLVIPDMKVSEAHALQHKIENVLKSKFGSQISAIIHVEPYYESV
ncbi:MULTISPECIES: cation diffusion facilitator family transporter [Clostridiaceae]|uniref:Cation diffusion facilitator family transporter n=1 Tax=Hathewaya proteolytica DSM 3090 TaxID=1121331 RepID=A0A1M6QIQ3_9CLOT|nr:MULTISPECIES: cation diffusion facilitator family transporter [Clostridiaceae]KLE17214.1 cation transporter [Clostridium sp. C8]SHK20000.1 cation diffusion facilitator family transporter [Hathewaya proteolytica DSM 3090]